MRKQAIPGLCSVTTTVIAFLWTSYNLVPDGNILETSSIFSRIIVVTFLAWIGSGLWSSMIVVVLAMPLYLLLGGRFDRNSEEKPWALGFFHNASLSFILFWIQFFLFGNGLPFVLF